MNNPLAVVTLPPHLQALVQHQGLSALNASAAGGISAGSWPQISIKGSRFRLQDPQGQEVVVNEFYLDVVIVDANPQLSKRYYAGAYDPNKEGSAPDCYSDNGVGPSVRSSKPQCGTCASCPQNVWGSKITPSGSQIKACADIKKVAVLIAANTSGPVFELDVPAASLTNFGAYIRSLDAAGIPAASIITRLQFDTAADYPKLLFGTPTLQAGQTPYITPEMLADVMDVIGSAEITRCIGMDDKLIDPARVGAAATTVIAQTPQQQYDAHNRITRLPDPPLPTTPPPVQIPLAQVGPTPPPNPSFPHVGTPEVPAAAQEPVKRTRSRKAAAPVEQAPPPVPAQYPPPTGATPPMYPQQSAERPPSMPPSVRDAQVPLNPPVASAELDDLIARTMNV